MSQTSMARHLAPLILRLAGLGLALAHGWGKVAALATGNADRLIDGVDALGFPLPVVFAWAAALAEFVGGLCVALGLGTRVAAGFAAFTMFVAVFLRHRLHLHVLAFFGLGEGDPVERWGNPELAFVYLISHLTLIFIGGGRFSFDHLIRRKRA